MLRTFGLTHIALKVKDLEKSKSFYQALFGVRVMYETEDFIQLQTPNSKDIIVLEKGEFSADGNNGILHFGFRLETPIDALTLVSEVTAAGGQVKEKGEFVAGEPYVFALDPDGHEVEIWYEKLPQHLSDFN